MSAGCVSLTAGHAPITIFTAAFGQGGNRLAKRTTHRSSTGKKLYAVRDSKGRFKDIQTYQRAHAADLRKKSKKEKKGK